jgi:hypothetical protein
MKTGPLSSKGKYLADNKNWREADDAITAHKQQIRRQKSNHLFAPTFDHASVAAQSKSIKIALEVKAPDRESSDYPLTC